jgi:hypothetical protein
VNALYRQASDAILYRYCYFEQNFLCETFNMTLKSYLYTYSAYKAVIVIDSCWANDEKRQQYNAEAEEDTTCIPYSLALTFKFAPNLKLFIFFLWGPACTKLRIEIETQRTKRNEILRNATIYTKRRNETQRNETDFTIMRNEMKWIQRNETNYKVRNAIERNGIYQNAMKFSL